MKADRDGVVDVTLGGSRNRGDLLSIPVDVDGRIKRPVRPGESDLISIGAALEIADGNQNLNITGGSRGMETSPISDDFVLVHARYEIGLGVASSFWRQHIDQNAVTVQLEVVIASAIVPGDADASI